MAANSRKKKLLLSAGSLLAAAALGAGIWFGTRGRGEPVNVYPFEFIGMTEFWGDAQESYGPVTTDKIQTEFLSDTQTVTEVPVKKGDVVKKGDILFSFDTTLDALSLERKRLEVEKVKVQIKAAEERLGYVRQLVPYTPVVPEIPKEDLGDQLQGPYKISENAVYDGSKPERALICWLKDGTAVSDEILQLLYDTSVEYQKKNTDKDDEKEESSASDVPVVLAATQDSSERSQTEKTFTVPGEFYCSNVPVKADTMTVGKEGYLIKDSYTYQGQTYWLESATPKNENAALDNLRIPPYPQEASEQPAWEALWKDGVEVRYMREVSITGEQLKTDAFEPIGEKLQLEVGQTAVLQFQSRIGNPPAGTTLKFTVVSEDEMLSVAHDKDYLILTGKPEEITSEPVSYTVKATYTFTDNHRVDRAIEESFNFSVSVVHTPSEKKGEFYAVFKVTEDNYLKGASKVWRGYKVIVYEGGKFELLPYDAMGFADHTLPPPEDIEIELPEILPDEMYTAEQIVDMQKQLYATIKEQTEKLVVVEKEYDVMRRELGDGNIYAEIDGKVMSVLTEEEAREEKQPLVKVSGGGGFYIEGSVSELEKASLKIGQEITVNDWNSGNTYTGEVVSISDFPAENDNWNGIGNPTASYYPYKAFVGEEADLEAGSYVSMSYSASAAEHGIYLEKAFVRTEKGESYIYVRGADGKLEKRTVQVGKVLWGSYYEILSDLSEEDYLAFPYGKDVKQGAPTVESDLSVLYTY